eukprot:1183995-Prorocentrum_minimum.AAC.3
MANILFCVFCDCRYRRGVCKATHNEYLGALFESPLDGSDARHPGTPTSWEVCEVPTGERPVGKTFIPCNNDNSASTRQIMFSARPSHTRLRQGPFVRALAVGPRYKVR